MFADRRFADRNQAGRQLAELLVQRLTGVRTTDVVVLGLPRGGVPVAFEVAQALRAPLDVIVVRKLGVPGQPELAMGAVGEDDVVVLNLPVIGTARVSQDELAEVRDAESAQVRRRTALLRENRTPVPIAGRTVVVVDDGMATGSTAQAACQVARARGAAEVILAVPVAAADAARRLRSVADEVVCLQTPQWFAAVGQWYDDFRPVSDDEVVALLAQAAAAPSPGTRPASAPSGMQSGVDGEVQVRAGNVVLAGTLSVPAGASSVVIFVHGSGSSRHSPRNTYVAQVLNDAGIATLLFDLLTVDEERSRANVFDIRLLAGRLAAVTAWVRAQSWARSLPIGWFGASTGGGAALWAAAEPDADVAAIVSRGGRPDLAMARLAAVRAPTLLIVGGEDDMVLELNREAAAEMHCPHQLSVVPGATHLFEEPGTLAAMAELARDWFVQRLTLTGATATAGGA